MRYLLYTSVGLAVTNFIVQLAGQYDSKGIWDFGKGIWDLGKGIWSKGIW